MGVVLSAPPSSPAPHGGGCFTVVVGFLGVALVLFALAFWGGSMIIGPRFYIGLVLLLSLILVFGLSMVWLFFSPLPANTLVVPPPDYVADVRQVLVLIASLSGLLLATGGMWDQVWHVRYDGFGDDFLWPPHFMIYSSIGLILCFAGVGLLLLARGCGSLRVRVRSEAPIAFLGLVSAFMVASTPSDAIWHQIYGLDITGWSLPHLLITVNFMLVMSSALALQLSLLGERSWKGWQGWNWSEVVALLPIVWASITLLQALTVEWEGITVIIQTPQSAFQRAFWSRPEWLYPVIVAMVALFIGNVVLHALRRVGAATLVGMLMVGYRLGVFAVVNQTDPDIHILLTAQFLVLPGMLALDFWYALRLSRVDLPGTQFLGNVFAGLIYLMCGLPLIAATMIYPRINAMTLPGMIVGTIVVALGAGWAGAHFGGWLAVLGQRSQTTVRSRPSVRRATYALLGVILACAVMYMVNAPPPMR